jgi:hypothetical protein
MNQHFVAEQTTPFFNADQLAAKILKAARRTCCSIFLLFAAVRSIASTDLALFVLHVLYQIPWLALKKRADRFQRCP